jgi:hypothetical protein
MFIRDGMNIGRLCLSLKGGKMVEKNHNNKWKKRENWDLKMSIVGNFKIIYTHQGMN